VGAIFPLAVFVHGSMDFVTINFLLFIFNLKARLYITKSHVKPPFVTTILVVLAVDVRCIFADLSHNPQVD
jgi:hypothetical protein